MQNRRQLKKCLISCVWASPISYVACVHSRPQSLLSPLLSGDAWARGSGDGNITVLVTSLFGSIRFLSPLAWGSCATDGTRVNCACASRSATRNPGPTSVYHYSSTRRDWPVRKPLSVCLSRWFLFFFFSFNFPLLEYFQFEQMKKKEKRNHAHDIAPEKHSNTGTRKFMQGKC